MMNQEYQNLKVLNTQGLNSHFLHYLLERVSDNSEPIRFLNKQGEYREYSYRQLFQDSKKYAAYFNSQGVTEGDVVSILLPTCEEFLAAFFALQMLKAYPVSIYPPSSLIDLKNWNQKVKQQLEQVAGKHILTDKRIARILSVNIIGKEINTHLVEKINSYQGHPYPLDIETYNGEDVCFLQFSSGTTSIPKAILIKQKNAILNAHLIREALPAPNNEISVACWLPLYHDMGLVGCLLMSILNSSRLVLIRPDDFILRPYLWLKAMHDFKLNMTTAPNFAYGLVQKRVDLSFIESLDLSHVKAFLCGAEMVYEETMNKFLGHLIPAKLNPKSLLPVYGMAETTLAISFSDKETGIQFLKVDKDSLQQGQVVVSSASDALSICCVGKLLPSFELKIVDKNEKILTDKKVGKILVKGPCITDGYYGNAKQTSSVIQQGWLDTGDEGFLYNQELYICGRIKDTMVIRGRNYYPTNFEERINDIKGIRKGRAIVSSCYNRLNNSEEVVVLVELEKYKKNELQLLEIRNQIKKIFMDESLPVWAIELFPAATLLKTSSGKLKRKENIQKWLTNKLLKNRSFVDRVKIFLMNAI